MIIAAIAIAVLLVVLALVCEYFLHFALDASVKNTDEDNDPVFTGDFNQNERKISKDFLEKECTEVWTTSKEGLRLHAYLYEKSGSDKYLVTMHGYKGDALNNGSFYRPVAESGWNVLVVEVRGHGRSEGKWLSMGLWESEDLKRWCAFLAERNPKAKIILHGVSMGGATVMLASNDPHPAVVGVVEDCGYSSVYDEFACQLKAMFHLPTHPLLDIVNLYCRIRLGFLFSSVSPIKAVAKSTLPIMFIHGDADDFVPTSMVKDCFEAHKGKKELYLTEGVKHAASTVVCKDEYCRKALAFMDSCL